MIMILKVSEGKLFYELSFSNTIGVKDMGRIWGVLLLFYIFSWVTFA